MKMTIRNSPIVSSILFYSMVVLFPPSAFANCPPVAQFGLSTSTSGSVEEPNNAIGVIESIGTGLNLANSARLRSNDVLTIQMAHTLSAGTEVFISIARDNNNGIASISDGQGNVINFANGPNDIAQQISITLAGPSDRIIIRRQAGSIWVDGLFYEVEDCDSDGVADLLDEDSDNDGIPNSIECEIFCASIGLNNSSFDEPFIAPNTFRLIPLVDVPGWNTTDPSGDIEIWGTGFLGVPSFEGSQHAELNANNPGALFQEICVPPGSIISWSLAHRGRNGTDVAQVRIGENLTNATVQVVMTTGNTAWQVYSGTYMVPANQLNTVLIFEAVSTAGGSLSIGNFIDGIEIGLISIGCTDTDNDGLPNYLDLDSDNDGILDAIEAGHGFPVDTNGRLAGSDTGSGANGLFDPLETAVESSIINYVVSDSEENPDNMFDPYELDSDGDGCFDTIETNQVDEDEDGTIGTGIPTVDPTTGLVTTHSYGTPPLIDRWQNHLINHCQICRVATTNPHIRYNRRVN